MGTTCCHLKELQAVGTGWCTSQPKCNSGLALYAECKAVLLEPATTLGLFLSHGAGSCSAAPRRPRQEGDGYPVSPQPSMPVQMGDMAVSTSVSAPVVHTHATATGVTT